MSFTGNEDQTINLATAASLTANYRAANPPGADTIKGHYFAQVGINQILAQENCVGIRIYYGLDSDGKKELVITGVTADENDITTGVLLDRSIKCPPDCGNKNVLNGNL